MFELRQWAGCQCCLTTTNRRLALAEKLRILPSGTRGKARLARAIIGPAHDCHDVLVRDRFGHRFVVPEIGSPIAFELLINGVYEPVELQLILAWLGPGSVFVDVGANIGCYSLPAADVVGPSGRVLAIEASPTICRYLERNVDLNEVHNIEIVPLAAGEHVGTVTFHEAPGHSFGMGSIGPQFAAPPIQVPVSTLDALLQNRGIAHVDAIKVDVEGFELAVFRGARETLTRNNPPAVLFEFLDWAEQRAQLAPVGAAQELLMQWGYRLWTTAGFARGMPPLAEPLRSGGAMLVAIRSDRQVAGGPRGR